MISDSRDQAERERTRAGVNRWELQKFHGGKEKPLAERGDCMRTCFAGVLGVPRDDVPNIHGGEWWDAWQQHMETRGYTLVSHLVGKLENGGTVPRCLWVASVPNGAGALHMVVAKGRRLVHDPEGHWTDETFQKALNDGDVHDAIVIVQLDPGSPLPCGQPNQDTGSSHKDENPNPIQDGGK